MMNKIMNIFLSYLVSAVIMSINDLAFAEYKFICPPELVVEQNVAQEVSGWQKYGSNKSHPFVNLLFSEGSPSEEYILVPDGDRKVKGVTIVEWEFSKSMEGYWVTCEYDDTSATVTRKLPDDVAYCEAEYDRIFPRAHVKRWHCLSEAELKQKKESKKRKAKKPAIVSYDTWIFAGSEIACPRELTFQQNADQEMIGWHNVDSNISLPFMNVSFSKGLPEKQKILNPTKKRNLKGEPIVESELIKEAFLLSWELPKSTEGYWISCLYDGAGATISRKLSDNAEYCETECGINGSRTFVQRWRCISEEQLKQEAEIKQKAKSRRKIN